jgi:hypothetical protein
VASAVRAPPADGRGRFVQLDSLDEIYARAFSMHPSTTLSDFPRPFPGPTGRPGPFRPSAVRDASFMDGSRCVMFLDSSRARDRVRNLP